jgi:hypothetical protein
MKFYYDEQHFRQKGAKEKADQWNTVKALASY